MLRTRETLGFQESGEKIVIYAKNKGDPGFQESGKKIVTFAKNKGDPGFPRIR